MNLSERYGPWAVVVGGSEALGASFARQLGEAGLNLVIVARKPGPLAETAETIRAESGVEVRTVSLDLAGDDILGPIRAATDDIDVGLLVYNAGAAHRTGGFLEGTLEDALRTIRVNPIGQVTLAYHFGRRMVSRGRGGIVIMGSMASVAGAPGIVIYCAAKAFGQIFAEGLWTELKPHGIDVLQVPLGSFNTPAMARIGLHYGPEHTSGDPDQQVREILEKIGDGPIFIPSNVAEGFRVVAAMPRREAAELMVDRMRAIPGFNTPV